MPPDGMDIDPPDRAVSTGPDGAATRRLFLQRKSILVVEDDSDIRETLKLTLEVEGYRVESAAHGQEALERLQDMPRPCLILLDLMMPVMSGFQFLAVKEKNITIAPIPVVIVSAFSEEARKVNTQGFVKKPVDLEILLPLVRHYCDKGGTGNPRQFP